jgi:hypothetical protein
MRRVRGLYRNPADSPPRHESQRGHVLPALPHGSRANNNGLAPWAMRPWCEPIYYSRYGKHLFKKGEILRTGSSVPGTIFTWRTERLRRGSGVERLRRFSSTGSKTISSTFRMN